MVAHGSSTGPRVPQARDAQPGKNTRPPVTVGYLSIVPNFEVRTHIYHACIDMCRGLHTTC